MERTLLLIAIGQMISIVCRRQLDTARRIKTIFIVTDTHAPPWP